MKPAELLTMLVILMAGEITELLSEDSTEISVRAVERVLAEEGFSKLLRHTRQKTGFTVKDADSKLDGVYRS